MSLFPLALLIVLLDKSALPSAPPIRVFKISMVVVGLVCYSLFLIWRHKLEHARDHQRTKDLAESHTSEFRIIQISEELSDEDDGLD